MELKTILEQIGLTEGESKVYLALLSLGQTTTGPIVKESGISASKAYEILDRLSKKGLVSHIMKTKTKYFRAADPSRIIDYLEEKEKLIHNQKNKVKKILPVLKQKEAGKHEEAEVFEGQKGIMTARERVFSVLKKGETLQVMGSSKKAQQAMDAYWKDFHKRRTKAGIKAKYIVEEDLKEDLEIKKAKGGLIKARYLPLMGPIHIDLYGDYTVLNLVQDTKLALSIKNKQVTDSFRHYFDLIWNQKVKVFRGLKESTSFFDDILLKELKKGEEYFIFNANWGLGNVPGITEFFEGYHKRRQAKGIKVNFLFNSSLGRNVGGFTLPPCEYKFLPQEFKSPLQVTLYKDKLYISIWSKNPIGFLIESKQVVDAFKIYFDIMWKQETKIVKGLDAIQDLFEEMLDAGSCDFIGARGYFMDARPRYIDDWEKRAIEKGFTYRNIVNIDHKGHRNTKFSFAQTKYTIPKEFSNLSVFWIYGNKVVISNWYQKEPIAVIIENKALYDMYKKQFELLWNQETTTFKGYRGIRAVCDNILEELKYGGEYLDFGVSGSFKDVMGPYWDIWQKKKRKWNIKSKCIFDETLIEKNPKLLKDYFGEARFHPKEYHSPTDTIIYKDTVVLFIWTAKPPIAIVIQNKENAEGYRNQFKLMWKFAKKA